MSRRLPPLNSLRAFEAAARHGNFRKAADELSVTHSAVSHQIKLLEDYLEVELFHRRARAVDLTEAGKHYFPILQTAFDKIADGTEELRSNIATSELTIQAYTTFAISWLSSRLPEFQRQNPKLRVRLNMATWDAELHREIVDIAIGTITRNKITDPEIHYEKLFTSHLFPVCSPMLLDGLEASENYEELNKQTILRVDTWSDDWALWIKEMGLSDEHLGSSLTFDTYALALEAALDGIGIAMTRTPFGKRELAAGWLVAPFKHAVKAHDDWYVMMRKERRESKKIIHFTNWLKSAVSRDPYLGDEFSFR
jgi:LysR family glycine cleavage system transcriptional activator